MSDDRWPLAHNTARSGPNQDVPVIIEYPAGYNFPPGERDRDWHEASDEEYQAYLDYWNALYDREEAERGGNDGEH
jgi:hypothetical protein